MQAHPQSYEIPLHNAHLNGRQATDLHFHFSADKPTHCILSKPAGQQQELPFEQIGAIKVAFVPLQHAKITLEFRKPVKGLGEGKAFGFLTAEVAVQHIPDLDRVFRLANCQRRLSKGARSPAWLMSAPFNVMYSWQLREAVALGLTALQVLLTVALCYEFFMFLPAIFTTGVLETLEWLQGFVSSQAQRLYETHPIPVMIVTPMLLLISWPILFATLGFFAAIWISSQLVKLSMGLTLLHNIHATYKTIRYYLKMTLGLVSWLIKTIFSSGQKAKVD